ncbi:MAG: sulfotransferase [Bdellovibrionales bacterium]|nr:sulfotransferase [Bdellovibrionales bacterium]
MEGKDRPIFIIGTERSGTNLLRVILNQHPHIHVPHPPHIHKNFYPLLSQYGDLKQKPNFLRLAKDVVRSVLWHFYPWELSINVEELIANIPTPTLNSLFFAIYDESLKVSSKSRWCCKSTFVIHHVESLLNDRPDSQFIFMVRDGRDVAVSAKKSVFNHFHTHYIAQLWQKEQRLGLDLLKKFPEKIYLLRYEKLISSPISEIERLCQFLGESYNSEMMDYPKSKEARKSSQLSDSWKNTGQEVLSNNQKKYLKELAPWEIALFEKIAGAELQELDYSMETSTDFDSDLAPSFGARVSESFYSLYFPLLAVFRDKNGWLRLRQKLFVSALRWLR